MEEARTCPVCGTQVAPASHECDRCGFRLVGLTEELPTPQSGSQQSGSPQGSLAGDSGAIPAAARHGKPHLTLTKGPLKGEVFDLEVFPISIGRDPGCDIFLNNMTVSRVHAFIECDGNRTTVRDNNSLNGTWVDGKIVEEAELLEDTLLQIGTFSMRFSAK